MAPLTDDKHDGIEHDRRFFHSFPRPKQGETSSLHLRPTEISAVPAYNPYRGLHPDSREVALFWYLHF